MIKIGLVFQSTITNEAARFSAAGCNQYFKKMFSAILVKSVAIMIELVLPDAINSE